MTKKTRSIVLETVLILLIVTLMGFSLTYGRFFQEAESGGDYGSDNEYVVSDEIIVKNEDEFAGAIENGYSNIKIDESAESPLFITDGVQDVAADLILDLNGHEIFRNSREPMLNIIDGFNMTIIDTSAIDAQTGKKKGAMYNPVGTVLSVGGGTLTVAGGNFESGPRAGEYVKNGSVTETGALYPVMRI